LTKEEKRRMHSIVKCIRWRLWSFDKAIANHVEPDAVGFELGLVPYIEELKDIPYAARARDAATNSHNEAGRGIPRPAAQDRLKGKGIAPTNGRPLLPSRESEP
jgi:hypothetical protein